MSKYKVSPQQAYMLAFGDLQGYPDVPCRLCGEPVCWYSQAGRSEVDISGSCEPCFDYVTWPSDEEAPAWMSAVEYTDEFLARHNTKEDR